MTELSQLLASHAGLILFLVVFAEMTGLPFPAAPVLVAAGALVADGTLSPVAGIAITVAACLLCDSLWFLVGRRHGNNLFRFIGKISRRETFDFGRTERLFAHHGALAIAAAKFIPGVGFLIPAFAGACRIPFGKFVCFDLLGSLLYGIFYMELGFLFGSEIAGALELLSEFGPEIRLVGLLALVTFVGYKYGQQRKTIKTAPATVPGALAT